MTDEDSTKGPVGPPFRGGSLEGADFSGRDLRGADFTGADLASASFRDATFGVAPRVGSVLLALAMLAAIAAGAGIGWAVDRLRDRLSADQWDEVAGGGSVGLVLIVFIALILWRGFDFAIKIGAVFYLVVLVVNIVANLLWDDFEWVVAARTTALVLFIVLAITVGVLGRVVGGVFGAWSIALVAVLGGLASGRFDGGAGGIVIALSLVAVSKRAVRGDPRDRTLRRIAHWLVSRWGTTFADADLTGADFTGADTGRCSVGGATVDGVTWDPKKPLPPDLPDGAVVAGR
jgi:hypothetical protein